MYHAQKCPTAKDCDYTVMEPLPVVVSNDKTKQNKTKQNKTKQKVSFMAGAELISGTQLYRPPFYFAWLI